MSASGDLMVISVVHILGSMPTDGGLSIPALEKAGAVRRHLSGKVRYSQHVLCSSTTDLLRHSYCNSSISMVIGKILFTDDDSRMMSSQP